MTKRACRKGGRQIGLQGRPAAVRSRRAMPCGSAPAQRPGPDRGRPPCCSRRRAPTGPRPMPRRGCPPRLQPRVDLAHHAHRLGNAGAGGRSTSIWNWSRSTPGKNCGVSVGRDRKPITGRTSDSATVRSGLAIDRASTARKPRISAPSRAGGHRPCAASARRWRG
jgi:hypothetical protein